MALVLPTRVSILTLGLGFSLMGACQRNPPTHFPEGTSVVEKSCEVPHGSPTVLPRLDAIQMPLSRIWIHSEVSVSLLERRIAQAIPKQLAAEKGRAIGAAGKASYRVMRGHPRLYKTNEGVRLTLPISANISVCKPFGRSCFRYGSCSPRLEARFSFSTLLGKNYQLPAPKGTITATKKCVIGIDVTPRIEALARREVKKIERRLSGVLPMIRPSLTDSWRKSHQPFSVSPQSCLQFSPKKLIYARPKLVKEGAATHSTALQGALGIQGSLEIASTCERKDSIPPLPALSRTGSPSILSELSVPELLNFSHVEEQLTRSASGFYAGDSVNRVQVLRTQFVPGGVALFVEASGKVCGQFWLVAAFEHRVGDRYLRLAKVSREGQSRPSHQMKQLIGWVKENTRVSRGSGSAFGEENARNLLQKHLPNWAKITIKRWSEKSSSVKIDKKGVYLFHHIESQVALVPVLDKLPLP